MPALCWEPDAPLYGKALHQMHELFPGNILCFIWVARPLESSIAQSFIAQAEPVSFIDQAFDPVFPGSAKEKKCAIL